MQEVAPGLWRWVVRHPEWTPEEDWPPEVACLVCETGDGLVLIDPLVPSDDAESLWPSLDAHVERSGRPPHVLITLFWHARSAQEILDRYPGARVWAHEPARALIAERTSWTDLFRAGDALPGGIEAIDARRAFEALFWLPHQRTLVAGDVLLGTEDGGIRLLPDSWLGGADRSAFFAGIRRVLELPIERILPAHGPPVLANGQDVLSHALDLRMSESEGGGSSSA